MVLVGVEDVVVDTAVVTVGAVEAGEVEVVVGALVADFVFTG